MRLTHIFKFDFKSFYHCLILVVVISLILIVAPYLHFSDPTWALISGVVCIETEFDSISVAVWQRILSTLIGAGIGCFLLYFLTFGTSGLIVGVFLISFICHFVVFLRNNWKLATATGVIVLIAASQQHSLVAAETIALKRGMEVIVGCLCAGVVGFLMGKLWDTCLRPRR
jgi:uncharacterized membrane protein YgaE (UPF0421/DUF939 family)